MKRYYDPNDYKQLSSDSQMIQAAVDEASKYGAEVVIPRFNERRGEPIWIIDEGIKLYTGSFVTLENCHIRLEDDTVIHFFENSIADSEPSWWDPAIRQYDITLRGVGRPVLDGGKHNGLYEKDFNVYDSEGRFVKKQTVRGFDGAYVNRGLQFRNVERISVDNIKIINARYWGMNFEFCSYGHISNISFDYTADEPNRDGIDVRVGCNNFLIENICGKTGDDTIALTNFGNAEAKEQFPDIDVDIHDVIIKNVRSYLTGKCDCIRLLNRGGACIYNVQISNLIDITPEGSESYRPLAAVRIGDINNYPSRLNLPGEIRNIVVRDVITRARFGIWIANSLVDSSFDNIMMTSEGGIGIYVNCAALKNVYVNKLTYNSLSKVPATDIGYKHISHKVQIDRIYAVYFKESTADNVCLSHIVSGKGVECVLGSSNGISVKASGIVTSDENTQLTENLTIV